MSVRIATFNVEALDDGPSVKPPLTDRIQIMLPQLERVAADIICLQEINSQGASGSRTLAALDQLQRHVVCGIQQADDAHNFRPTL
jgi:exonuclease III